MDQTPFPAFFVHFPCQCETERKTKESCYWYGEEPDMGAHIPFCSKNGIFPLEDCGDCSEYIDRRRKLKITVEYDDDER